MIIVTAPAGYGKTSLLVDLARQVELPVCWYALDSLDQDPKRFIAHFIASLAQRFPNFGKGSTAALQSTASTDLDLDRLVAIIVNEVFEHVREHFMVVLDDYHSVGENETINRFINQFVQAVDENCHLILSSRTLVTLPDLPLMVARSQVGGLGFEELAFRADEIQALVLQNYHLTMPKSVAEELASETEGWITALLLSAHTMWQGMIDRIRTARVSGVGLYEYLAQQVLDQQPALIRDFLLRTSLLEEFDAELCEAVFGPSEDWQGLIETVLQRNLFILPVEDERTWLRYHHLFRDFLQARFAQERRDEKNRILRRLADVYVERKQWEKAYDIYKRLADVAATAELIEQAGSSLIKAGRLTTLAEWLDALPPGVLASHYALASLRGIVAVTLGEVKRGLSLLNTAEAGLRAVEDQPGLARTLERRAVAYRFLGRYQASLADANEALALAERDESMCAIEAAGLRAKGLSLYYMGHLDKAIAWLKRSLAAYLALNDEQNAALLLMELGMAHKNNGRYDRALAHYEQALTYWKRANNIVRQAALLNNLGVLYHLKGDYEQAGQLLDKALRYSQQSGYARIEALALSSMGDLYADLDAPEAALAAYRRARETAQRIEDRFLLLYLNLAEATLARSRGDFRQAKQRLEAAEPLALESNSQYQQGLWQLERGRLALAEGEAPKALACLEGATRCFDDGDQRVEGARSHLLLAAAYRDAGEMHAAMLHLERSFRLASNSGAQHTLVVTGREARQLLEAATSEVALGRQALQMLQQVSQFERKIPALRRRLRRQALAVTLGPPRLTIQTLGRTRVELNGKPVTDPEWQSRRLVRELFFLFLAHPDGLSKEAIGAMLWPDDSPAQLKLRFKNAIYRLRRALGQEVILFQGNVYRFNRALDYEYDVEAFLGKMSQARAATEPAEQVAAYRDAVCLYKGFYLLDADGTWVWAERERLHRAYLEAVLKLAEHDLEAAEYKEALSYCQRALSEDPCFEEAHRLAMRAHAAMGNRAAVTRQFELCRQALLEEIDAPPSARTETLYETLMR